MFKKIFFAVVFMAFFSLGHAQEEINIVWGFHIGNNQVTTIRGMIEELNQHQNKYRFQLVHRPGAGGTISANSATSNPNNTIVAMSSSFIIRPYFVKDSPTHNLNTFNPILVQGNGVPLFIVSAQITKMQDLIKHPNATIGVSGIGSISHLVASEIVALNPSARIINFKNMIDAATAAAGGHVDAAIAFKVDIQGIVEAKKLSVLGYTGSKPLAGFEDSLLPKNSFAEMVSVTANHAMYVSTSMAPERFHEIRSLMTWANKTPKTLEGHGKNQMIPSDLDLTQTQAWYESERKFWQNKITKIHTKVEEAK